MNNKFIALNSNDDVLLFSQQTFLVGNFIAKIKSEFYQKFTQNTGSGLPPTRIFSNCSIDPASFKLDTIKWESAKEGINCKLLMIGSKGWKQGKIRMNISIEIVLAESLRNTDGIKTNVVLEFCPDEPDEPDEPESPLDDIRKLIQQAESQL